MVVSDTSCLKQTCEIAKDLRVQYSKYSDVYEVVELKTLTV